MDDAGVSAKARAWGMLEFMELARLWYLRCHQYSVFCTAMVFPIELNGKHCVMYAESSAESNRMMAEHNADPAAVVTTPAWMQWVCYRFDNMILDNIHGMQNSDFAVSSKPIGYLHEVLDFNYGRNWREVWCLDGRPVFGRTS